MPTEPEKLKIVVCRDMGEKAMSLLHESGHEVGGHHVLPGVVVDRQTEIGNLVVIPTDPGLSRVSRATVQTVGSRQYSRSCRDLCYDVRQGKSLLATLIAATSSLTWH